MVPTAVAQVVRGFLMGAADVVPGVSGGTIALLLGIYERLIEAVRTGAQALGRLIRGDLAGAIDRLKAVDWLFLLPLLAGIGLALVALAGLIDTALEDHPEEMAGLFFGLVVASVLVAWRLIDRPDASTVGLAAVTGIAFFALLGLQSGPTADPSPLAYLGAGAVAICAMILPGISGSFILLMLGMYAAVINAVHERTLGELVVFGVGAVIGLAVFSTLLSWLLERYHRFVMAAMVGLMLGSLRVLWPWPNGVGIISDSEEEAIDGTGLGWPAADEVVGPVLLAVVAAAAVVALSWWSERRLVAEAPKVPAD